MLFVSSHNDKDQLKTQGYYDSSLVKQRKHFGTSEQKKKNIEQEFFWDKKNEK